jgi:hypothetical protein
MPPQTYARLPNQLVSPSVTVPSETKRITAHHRFALGGCLLLGSHIAALLLLSASSGKLVSEYLFVVDNVFALIYLDGAHRRAQGVARTYWLLISATFAIFGFANAVWVYQASSGVELPFRTAWLFSYRFYVAPLAMTLFLRPDQDSEGCRKAASGRAQPTHGIRPSAAVRSPAKKRPTS